jgi:small subunit ribosomal protein S19
MARSIKKGPYVDEKLIKKVAAQKPGQGPIQTWARRSQIPPEFVGYTFGVHNGKKHIDVLVTDEMVGHRLGEFSPTVQFGKHGGRMQKEAEIQQKEAEIAAAKAAKGTDEAVAVPSGK